MDLATIFILILTFAMAMVILLDTSRYIIPNTLNGALLVTYVFAAYLLGLPWLAALGAAAIVLFIGMMIFALGLMGGGDIKLLTVLTLWTGWSVATPYFLLFTGLTGGILVIVVFTARFLLAPLWVRLSRSKTLPRILRRKQPVPYGIAIALAFLLMLYIDQVPGL